MIVEQTTECANAGCTCEVPAGQQCCSLYCAIAAKRHEAVTTAGDCNCSHAQCGNCDILDAVA